MNTEFKGTKGKWSNIYTLGYDNDIVSKNGGIICDFTFTDIIIEEELEANAKLIASAPDLLEACVQSLIMCDRLFMPKNDLKIMAERLKKAINKALN